MNYVFSAFLIIAAFLVGYDFRKGYEFYDKCTQEGNTHVSGRPSLCISTDGRILRAR